MVVVGPGGLFDEVSRIKVDATKNMNQCTISILQLCYPLASSIKGLNLFSVGVSICDAH